MSNNQFRFVVCATKDQSLVEYNTNQIERAAEFYDWLSSSDYKTRVFDNEHRVFVHPTVLNLMLMQHQA